MPGYLAVKALPSFPTNVVSKCAVYHVTSPSAFAFAARSGNSSSARAGACAAKIANEDNTDIAQGSFMSALHRVGVGSGIRFGLAPGVFPWRRESLQIEQIRQPFAHVWRGRSRRPRRARRSTKPNGVSELRCTRRRMRSRLPLGLVQNAGERG